MEKENDMGLLFTNLSICYKVNIITLTLLLYIDGLEYYNCIHYTLTFLSVTYKLLLNYYCINRIDFV
jgi:hypothetical protein